MQSIHSIFEAISEGNIEKVMCMIKRNPSYLYEKDDYGYTPFMEVLHQKRLDMALAFLEIEEMDVNAKNRRRL